MELGSTGTPGSRLPKRSTTTSMPRARIDVHSAASSGAPLWYSRPSRISKISSAHLRAPANQAAVTVPATSTGGVRLPGLPDQGDERLGAAPVGRVDVAKLLGHQRVFVRYAHQNRGDSAENAEVRGRPPHRQRGAQHCGEETRVDGMAHDGVRAAPNEFMRLLDFGGTRPVPAERDPRPNGKRDLCEVQRDTKWAEHRKPRRDRRRQPDGRSYARSE